MFLAYQLSPSGYGIKVKLAELWKSPIQKNHSGSTQMRLDGIKYAIINIKNKPMGFGIGQFHYIKYNKNIIIPKHKGSVETSYLVTTLQLGMLGGILFVLLLSSYGYVVKTQKELTMEHATGALILVCLGALTFPLFFTTTGLSILLAGVGTQLWASK